MSTRRFIVGSSAPLGTTTNTAQAAGCIGGATRAAASAQTASACVPNCGAAAAATTQALSPMSQAAFPNGVSNRSAAAAATTPVLDDDKQVYNQQEEEPVEPEGVDLHYAEMTTRRYKVSPFTYAEVIQASFEFPDELLQMKHYLMCISAPHVSRDIGLTADEFCPEDQHSMLRKPWLALHRIVKDNGFVILHPPILMNGDSVTPTVPPEEQQHGLYGGQHPLVLNITAVALALWSIVSVPDIGVAVGNHSLVVSPSNITAQGIEYASKGVQWVTSLVRRNETKTKEEKIDVLIDRLDRIMENVMKTMPWMIHVHEEIMQKIEEEDKKKKRLEQEQHGLYGGQHGRFKTRLTECKYIGQHSIGRWDKEMKEFRCPRCGGIVSSCVNERNPDGSQAMYGTHSIPAGYSVKPKPAASDSDEEWEHAVIAAGTGSVVQPSEKKEVPDEWDGEEDERKQSVVQSEARKQADELFASPATARKTTRKHKKKSYAAAAAAAASDSEDLDIDDEPVGTVIKVVPKKIETESEESDPDKPKWFLQMLGKSAMKHTASFFGRAGARSQAGSRGVKRQGRLSTKRVEKS